MDLKKIIKEKIIPEMPNNIIRIKLEVGCDSGFMESTELINFRKQN
jgi:hypothetical protein